MKTQIEKICGECKKVFYRNKDAWAEANGRYKYCSNQCRVKAHKGWVPGKEFRKKMSAYRKNIYGENTPRWSGGKRIDADGYVLVLNRTHPNRSKNNYVREHRIVAEKMLNRLLRKDEIIHHINGIKTDNSPENIMITNRSEHRKLHKKECVYV